MAEQELPSLASELRRLRLEAGLSQEALAARAGLSPDAIAALERGRRRSPRPSTLSLLADALELEPEQRDSLTAIARQPALDRDESRLFSIAPEHRPRLNIDPLVGREADLAEVIALVDQARLVTLTGPAGVGKTRLALAAAGDAQGDFEDGACWVSLVAARDGTALLRTVTAALGMREEPGVDLLESLSHHLQSRHLLLVLDHCDQVVGPCAALCRTLLAVVRRVTILVTSRELLRANGENVWVVSPLSVPKHGSPAHLLETYPSVQLFVQLARARTPQFSITAENAGAVADICARLEGLPLAIELAAARTNVLTVQQIAAELDEGLGLLSTATRKLSARHQTLLRAIDWSYDLLSSQEQALFARLSVFAGGWTLPAAEAVAVDADTSSAEALELTSRLVDKSLIGMRERRGRARFFMLGPLRQYGLSVLVESDGLRPARDAQAAYFLKIAEDAEAGLRGAAQAATLNVLEDEVDNLRAALAWSTTDGNHEVGLRLASALMMFWYLHGRYSEGREWLDAALRGGVARPALSRAKGLVASGTLAALECDYDLAGARTRAGLALYDELGDRRGVASALQRLGSVARELGRYDESERLHRESLECWQELGDEAGIANSLNFLGFVAWLRGDHDEAVELCSEALDAFRGLGDGEGVTWSLISLGVVAQYQGSLDEAEGRLQESLAVSRSLGFTEGVAWSLNQLGLVARRRLAWETAWELGRESLTLHRVLGDRWRAASVLEELAATAYGRLDPRMAARLVGAARAVRRAIGAPVPASEQPDYDRTAAALRTILSSESFAVALRDGRRTTLDRIDTILEAEPAGAASVRHTV